MTRRSACALGRSSIGDALRARTPFGRAWRCVWGGARRARSGAKRPRSLLLRWPGEVAGGWHGLAPRCGSCEAGLARHRPLTRSGGVRRTTPLGWSPCDFGAWALAWRLVAACGGRCRWDSPLCDAVSCFLRASYVAAELSWCDGRVRLRRRASRCAPRAYRRAAGGVPSDPPSLLLRKTVEAATACRVRRFSTDGVDK
jgi:hypothetical protein